MPIHDFRANQVSQRVSLPGISQSSHVSGSRKDKSLLPIDFKFQVHSNDLEEFLIPGFQSLDEAVKVYWSDIRVPTKDSYRYMRVKIAGGDKSLMIWQDDLANERVKLPVAAIDHVAEDFDVNRFSPPYMPMQIRYVNHKRDTASLIYRPMPFIVEYKLYLWAAHKTEVQTILYQVNTRFNNSGVAMFRMSDNKLSGNVQMMFKGSNDASDKELGFDRKQTFRYEVSFTAEAWLPLSERVVPTVLGRVLSTKDFGTQIFF